MTDPYHNFPDEVLVKAIEDAEREIKLKQSELKPLKHALLERRLPDIQAALRDKPEPFGAVSFTLEDRKVTFTMPKKVAWDQKQLFSLCQKIAADGADPAEYIDVEYTVSETRYKSWPSNIKEYFEPARTVTPGNVAIEIKEAKEK